MNLPMKLSSAIAAACLISVGVVAAERPAEIHIPGDRVVPESLTSDREGVIYIGSLAARTIFRVEPGSDTAQPWIQPGTDGMQSILGVLADDASKTLWACSISDPAPPDGPQPPPSTLYAFDLKSGSPKGKYVLPTAGAVCNDIAVGPDGTAYATDTANMQIVSLKRGAKALEVWSADDAFGPKGGVLDGIAVLKGAVYVNTLATSKLFRAPIQRDGKAGPATQVKLDRALERPDGMRTFGRNKLLIVEGGGPGRLARIDFDGEDGKLTTLKEGYPDNAVAVTVVGETGYVLEAQFKARRDPTYKANPFHATAVHVGKP